MMVETGVLPAIGYLFNANDTETTHVELEFEAGAGYLVIYSWTANQGAANWSGEMPENLLFRSGPVQVPSEAGDRHWYDDSSGLQPVLLADPYGWWAGVTRWGEWDDAHWFEYSPNYAQHYVYSDDATDECTVSYKRTNMSGPGANWRNDTEALFSVLKLDGDFGPQGDPPIFGTFWRRLLWFTEPYLGEPYTGIPYQWSSETQPPNYLSWITTGHYRRAVPVWPRRDALRIIRPGGKPMVFKSADTLEAWRQLIIMRHEQELNKAWNLTPDDRKKMAAKKIIDLHHYADRFPLTKTYAEMRIDLWKPLLLDE